MSSTCSPEACLTICEPAYNDPPNVPLEDVHDAPLDDTNFVGNNNSGRLFFHSAGEGEDPLAESLCNALRHAECHEEELPSHEEHDDCNDDDDPLFCSGRYISFFNLGLCLTAI